MMTIGKGKGKNFYCKVRSKEKPTRKSIVEEAMKVMKKTEEVVKMCVMEKGMFLDSSDAVSSGSRFTRIAGETFGMFIAVLFIQEAIKRLVSEFKVPKNEDPNREKYQFQWLYTNGLLAIVFSFGLLYTALKSRKARSWWYGTGKLRSFIADYGVPLMVVAWTALSFSVPSNIPSGVPRRLYSPLLWESESTYHWTVITDMGKVPPAYIFGSAERVQSQEPFSLPL